MKLCTEDGTVGFKGTTVDLLKDLLKKQHLQKVYACGPERMLYKVVELCKDHGIECEVSLERHIKCGFGVCGQCDCGGQRVCIDGPVFNTEELSRMEGLWQDNHNKNRCTGYSLASCNLNFIDITIQI